MPKDDREPHDVAAVPKVLGCEGMAQEMKPALGKPEIFQEAVVAPASIPMFPLHAISVEVEVAPTSGEQFIDATSCIEDAGGDGMDAPLNECPGLVSQDQS